MGIDDNPPLRIGDPQGIELIRVEAGLAPGAQEYAVAFQGNGVAPLVGPKTDAVRGLFGLPDVGRRMDDHAQTFQLLLQKLRRLLVLVGDDTVEDLHEGDRAAQFRQKGGEFDANDVAPMMTTAWAGW
jgi:hypothetical protein